MFEVALPAAELPGSGVELFRLLSTLVGALAVALLAWRLITTWEETVVLVHGLGMLLLVGILGGTMLSYQLRELDSPFAWGGVLSFSARLGTVILCLFWARWIDRKHSPFRRAPRRTL